VGLLAGADPDTVSGNSMLVLGKTPRFVVRLGAPADHDEQRRIERVLAAARVFLALSGLLAIYLDPTEPTRYSHAAYGLLFGYVLYAVAVWVALRRLPDLLPSFPWIHALDILFPAVFTLITEGPNSPFFLFFVFVLTAAAFRWGFPETVLTAVLISTLMLVEALLLSYAKPFGLEGEYEINRLVIRLSYLLILGVLLGYLAEAEKRLRAEDVFVARLISKARVDVGLRGTMQTVLGETLRLFLAPRALAVVQQASSGRVFIWESHLLENGSHSIAGSEAAPDERRQYLVALPAQATYAQRRRDGWATSAIGAEGKRVRIDPGWSPAAYPHMSEASSLLAVEFNMGREWSGCLLLFSPRSGDKLHELRFAQKFLHQIGPALYNVYLLRRLRSRAGAVERARVARELHDGAIQALIAVEMDVDLLRREAARGDHTASLAPRLERVQEMLREQVFDLRTLMQQMRPVELGSAQLLDHLADIVERFRRGTGIAAEFTSSLDDVELSPRVCRELVGITQEALANVRKHSGAQRVLVRFGVQQGNWTLQVEDDGRGFDFAGKKDLPELEASRKGPAVIKERVRILGGNLEIESLPGQGTRLQVTCPQKAHATYV
jgi:signal transduction histidine kinase